MTTTTAGRHAPVVLAALLLGLGCAGPTVPDCRVPCSATSGCPQGLSCSNGFCARGGVCASRDAEPEAASPVDGTATDTGADSSDGPDTRIDADGDAADGDTAPSDDRGDADSAETSGPDLDGAGEVRTEIRPSELAGLRLWLDAAELPVGPMKIWPDSSGHSMGALNIGNGPLVPGGEVVVTIDPQSALPVVEISGMNNVLTLDGDYSDFTGGLSIFMVLYPRPSYLPMPVRPGPTHLLEFGLLPRIFAHDESVIFQRTNNSDADLELQVYLNDDASLEGAVAPETIGNFSWQIVGEVMDGGAAGAPTNARVFRNGLQAALAPGSGRVYVPNVIARPSCLLGGSNYRLQGPAEVDGHFLGWIAEVLVYGRNLNDTERNGVENYLSAKWRVALDR